MWVTSGDAACGYAVRKNCDKLTRQSDGVQYYERRHVRRPR